MRRSSGWWLVAIAVLFHGWGCGAEGDSTLVGPRCDLDPPVDCPAAPPETVGGERPADVIVPADYDNGKDYPLVVVLHGYSTDSDFIQAFLSIDQHFIDDQELVLLAPNGSPAVDGRTPWNATMGVTEFVGDPPDDVAYLRTLVEEAQRRIAVDPNRIYLVGYSNGAGLALDTACRDPGLVTGVVSIAGALPADAACDDQPLSLLHVHGSEDDTVDPDGGKREGSCIVILSAEALVEGFGRRSGCAASPQNLANIDLSAVEPAAETTVSLYPRCQDQHVVELWKMEGVGHATIFAPTGRDLLFDWLLAQERPAAVTP